MDWVYCIDNYSLYFQSLKNPTVIIILQKNLLSTPVFEKMIIFLIQCFKKSNGGVLLITGKGAWRYVVWLGAKRYRRGDSGSRRPDLIPQFP